MLFFKIIVLDFLKLKFCVKTEERLVSVFYSNFSKSIDVITQIKLENRRIQFI